ncbi:DUF4232 domain-containing protein [Streptomyces sp. NA04227]|nr:DUF4232 domain-containing protein [Streptomyces sp. NA04227]
MPESPKGARNSKSPGNRRGWRSYALGATAIAALLSSTACESDTEGTADSKPSDRPTASSSAKPGGTDSAKPGGGSGESDGKDSGSGSTGGSGKGGNGEGGDSAGSENGANAPCTTEQLAVSATKEPADSKEARHLLLTVQNAGDKKCDLFHYPHVQLGANAQSTVPVIKDSSPDPGEPVTLAPGDEAHAALLVSGGGRDEYEAKSISLTLHGSKSGTKAGSPVDVPMPVDTLYADDGQLVTYWTTASGMALDFIMSK